MGILLAPIRNYKFSISAILINLKSYFTIIYYILYNIRRYTHYKTYKYYTSETSK